MLNNKLTFLFLVSYLIILTTCKKVERAMMVTTGTVSNISTNSAEVSGQSIDLGEGATKQGHCYAKTPNVTISSSIKPLEVPARIGSFTSQLTNLEIGTKYYIKAYISKGTEIIYGKEISFTTSSIPEVPTLSTTSITNITQTTATSGGNITTDGGASVTVRGVCWNTSVNPTITNFKTSDGTGSGSFVSNLIVLTPSTKYYVRAYATNSVGTAYGNEVSFTSSPIAVPALTTTAVTSITLTTAVSGGNITADGGGAITARGVCWATTTPTISNFITTDGTGSGSFTSNISGLLPNTKYYLRAYATNSAGTAYGDEISFTTSPIAVPTLTTTSVTSITLTTAVSGGNITADGGGAITARGVCWATTVNPTITDPKTTDGTGTGIFTSGLTTLLPGTTYHVRAYATNSSGTAYGNDVPFTTTAATLATLSTTPVTSITLTTAASGGNITADGGGAITARGVCWAITANPTITDPKTTDGTGTGIFTSGLTALLPGTTYHVRAYATNSAGTAYGNDVPFTTTAAALATLTTTAITSISLTTAVSGGNITSDGGGAITARGVCWATTSDPTISNNLTTNGTGTGSFTSNLSGLVVGTTYYIRAYANNSAGIAYGNQLIFNTKIADVESNTYNTVTLGTQVWMADNLKTTRFNDNTTITPVTDNTAWADLTTPAYCWYDNDAATYKSTCGALYNWYVVDVLSNGGKNVCPSGWHVPSDTDWTTLTDYLINNGYGYQGSGTDIAKSLSTQSGWMTFGTAGTPGNDQANNNSSGFTAFPSGYRDNSGFYGILSTADWWTGTMYSGTDAFGLYINYNNDIIGKTRYNKKDGFSVRCLKN